ncbi:MAG: hypothetical protein ACHQQQ_15420 [Bacteroidota bacterium]
MTHGKCREVVMHREHHISALLIFLSLLSPLIGCGDKEYTSRWRNRDIIIDGKNTEWSDSLITLTDDKQTSVGVCNDDDFLYISIITTNRGIERQIMRRGITFWFDRDGGKEKKFGIRYPLGMGGVVPPGGGNEDRDSGVSMNRKERTIDAPDELEIYQGEKEHHRMTLAETGGIEAKFQPSADTFVYELKVPLTDNVHPFGIGTKTGSVIGVGFDTKGSGEEVTPRAAGSEGEGGEGGRGGFGGGRGGFGGGRGGGGFGRGGGGRMGGGRRGGGGGPGSGPRQQVEQLDVWVKLHLAGKELSSN